MSNLIIWGKRSLIVALGPVVSLGSRFLGNVLLSRLLIPQEFGTAVAISVVLGLIGLVTDLALDRFVIVNSSTQALAAGQAISVIRGASLALVLFFGAPFIAVMFKIPQFTSSFAFAALFPFILGFTHLGIAQMKKYHNYTPSTVTGAIGSIANLTVTALLAVVLRNHWALLAGFLAEATAIVIVSHLLSRTPYQWRTNKEMLRAALVFGLPLTFNGFALATMSNLDRVFVGSIFGVEMLGRYAVILNMGITPTSFILSIVGTLGLPYLLSSRTGESSVSLEKYRLLVLICSALATLYGVWVVLTLDRLIPLIFGSTFSVTPLEHALIAGIAFLRLQRAASTNYLLTTARTTELALLNLAAVCGLSCGVAFSMLWPRLESMMIGIIIGDFIVFALFFFLSSARTASYEPIILINSAVAFATLAITAGMLMWTPQFTWQARGSIFVVGFLGIWLQWATGLRGHVTLHLAPKV